MLFDRSQDRTPDSGHHPDAQPDAIPAVVGDVEWVEFVSSDHPPRPGEVIDAEPLTELVAGAGADAASQLAHLAGHGVLYTALGDDELGHRALDQLHALGLTVHVAWRTAPTRRAFALIDDSAERTIIRIGPRLHPRGEDRLPWADLNGMAAVYFAAGDAAALHYARRAPTLVAHARAGDALTARVELDAIVYSAGDQLEQHIVSSLPPLPRLHVITRGMDGGIYRNGDTCGTWPPAPVPGPIVDAFGCGDAFAAGLTYALGRGLERGAALSAAAACGANCLTHRGPHHPRTSALHPAAGSHGSALQEAGPP